MFGLMRRKARLLILDDDASMQRLISALLRRAGYRFDIVSSGTQAIEKIGTTEYQALLLDLMTPTEGGLTVIKHLKTAKPELLRRVIVVSASPASVLKSVARDVAAVVHKPFDAKQLLDAIEGVLTK
jgi:two-component system response regulator AtoC